MLPVQIADSHRGQGLLVSHDVFDLREEPWIDACELVDVPQVHSDAKRIGNEQDAFGPRLPHLGFDFLALRRPLVEAVDSGFEAAQCFLHRFLEGPAHCHDLADRFHLRCQVRVGLRELLERKPRDLRHHVIDGRLERSWRGPAGNVVAEFIERVAYSQLGGNFRNRKTGRLRGQRRRTRHPRVHFNYCHAPVGRVDGKLDVGPTGINSDFAQHRDRGIAHDLVFLVGKRLRRCHRNRVAGVDAHRVEVLDRTDNDAVVLAVTHHFHFELFPADDGLFNEYLVGRRSVEPAFDDVDEFLPVVGNAAAGTAECERRANDRGKADRRLHLQRLFHAVGDHGTGTGEPDLAHRHLEFFAVLRFVDGLFIGTDHFDTIFFQHAVTRQIERTVQCSLTTHGRQQHVRAFDLDDSFDHLPGHRLDIGDIRHLRIGHYRRRVGIDQNDAIAFFAKCLASLRPRIIEFAGLTNHDRSGSDDQNRFDVIAFRHGNGFAQLPPGYPALFWSIIFTKRSNR